ncbi:MAG: M1 family metallopeptidase [Gemmatimonadetes bacterium]|nr:M1 family metallopeptidase [Gemmatimonadota bacterium]
MTVRRVLVATLACSALASLPRAARAQTTLPSLTGSSYRPGVDVLDYDVHLELPDSGLFLRGDVTVSARRAPSLAVLRLDLIDSLTVRSVAVDGRRVTATHSANALDVPLAGAKGDTVRVRVVYDGPVHDGLVVRKDARGRWTWFGDNWPDRTRQWLPTVDHPSDKATVSWTVRAPTGRTVVANGVLLGTKPVGAGRTETKWREGRPIPPSLMVIGAGPLVRYDLGETACRNGDRAQCVQQSVYVLPENTSWLPGAFQSAGPIVAMFQELVGPFPYEKLAHLQSNTRFGGMENASNIFYDGKLFPTQRVSDGLIAHETAHQWFGDAVTEREWAHLWLSEGFANYFAALWAQRAHGDTAFRRQMAAMREKILADRDVASRPVLDTAQTNYLALLNANSYDKGAWVLYMLHQQLGDSAFFRGLRSYYARYRDSTALSDDLRRELEQASGRSLGQYFDQWLRRPGFAKPAIGWAFDQSTGSVSLFVQQDAAPGPYAFPLTVVVTDAGNVAHRLSVDVPAEARATLPIPGHFERKPKSLSFDPDSLLLARIARL